MNLDNIWHNIWCVWDVWCVQKNTCRWCLDTAAGPIGQVAALGGIVHLSCMHSKNNVYWKTSISRTESRTYFPALITAEMILTLWNAGMRSFVSYSNWNQFILFSFGGLDDWKVDCWRPIFLRDSLLQPTIMPKTAKSWVIWERRLVEELRSHQQFKQFFAGLRPEIALQLRRSDVLQMHFQGSLSERSASQSFGNLKPRRQHGTP